MRDELNKIIEFLKDAPKPILIHCRAGADRTGLVSAIYRTLFMGQDLQSAEKSMLSIRWGHLSFGKTKAMNDYFLKIFPNKINDLKSHFGLE